MGRNRVSSEPSKAQYFNQQNNRAGNAERVKGYRLANKGIRQSVHFPQRKASSPPKKQKASFRPKGQVNRGKRLTTQSVRGVTRRTQDSSRDAIRKKRVEAEVRRRAALMRK